MRPTRHPGPIDLWSLPAGRIDSQFADATTEGERGDAHGVVKILSIDLGSH